MLTEALRLVEGKEIEELKKKVSRLGVTAKKSTDETEKEQLTTSIKQLQGRIAKLEKAMNEAEGAAISDELAAKKIASKIKGTPDLTVPKIQQYVVKYLGMVGKSQTDVKYLTALVHGILDDAGLLG